VEIFEPQRHGIDHHTYTETILRGSMGKNDFLAVLANMEDADASAGSIGVLREVNYQKTADYANHQTDGYEHTTNAIPSLTPKFMHYR
jgi:hypothetical protein